MTSSPRSIRPVFLRFLPLTLLAVTAGCSVHIGSDRNGKDGSGGWIRIHTPASWAIDQVKGSGVFKEERRQIAGVSRLVLALPVDVNIVQGPTESLSIEADDNLLPLIATRVENGTLTVDGEKRHGYRSQRTPKITLTVKTLEGIAIRGSGDVFAEGLKTDKLRVEVLGSGDVRLQSIDAANFDVEIAGSGDVKIDRLTARAVNARILGSGSVTMPALTAETADFAIRGSGDVEAAGKVGRMKAEIVGSGDIHAERLVSGETQVTILSSGDADVHATDKLTARVIGSGTIRYAGAPKDVERTIRGSGSIESR